MIVEFTHTAPDGYSYEFETFKRNIISIWIRDHRKYDYNNGKPMRCIWGFYNTKTKQFHQPVNSSTVGDSIDFSLTRPYTSMQIQRKNLEKFFE